MRGLTGLFASGLNVLGKRDNRSRIANGVKIMSTTKYKVRYKGYDSLGDTDEFLLVNHHHTSDISTIRYGNGVQVLIYEDGSDFQDAIIDILQNTDASRREPWDGKWEETG